MPPIRITDILLDVDAAVGFTDAFTHLRTGIPCGDRIGLLNVLLAEGLNLGLRKMAEATNTHDYWQLSRLARWHVESEAMNQALAMVVAAQGKLPMSRFWGMGTTASGDGQFFPSARQGEASATGSSCAFATYRRTVMMLATMPGGSARGMGWVSTDAAATAG